MNAKILVSLKTMQDHFQLMLTFTEKALNKSVMLFAANLDRCNTFPLVYVKF